MFSFYQRSADLLRLIYEGLRILHWVAAVTEAFCVAPSNGPGVCLVTLEAPHSVFPVHRVLSRLCLAAMTFREAVLGFQPDLSMGFMTLVALEI